MLIDPIYVRDEADSSSFTEKSRSIQWMRLVGFVMRVAWSSSEVRDCLMLNSSFRSSRSSGSGVEGSDMHVTVLCATADFDIRTACCVPYETIIALQYRKCSSLFETMGYFPRSTIVYMNFCYIQMLLPGNFADHRTRSNILSAPSLGSPHLTKAPSSLILSNLDFPNSRDTASLRKCVLVRGVSPAQVVVLLAVNHALAGQEQVGCCRRLVVEPSIIGKGETKTEIIVVAHDGDGVDVAIGMADINHLGAVLSDLAVIAGDVEQKRQVRCFSDHMGYEKSAFLVLEQYVCEEEVVDIPSKPG